jgi:hypothetical protein
MKIKIYVAIESEDGKPDVVDQIACIERGDLTPGTMGMTLSEVKSVLHGIQQTMGPQQAAAFAEAQRSCPLCRKSRARRGHHQIVYRTLFGKLRLQSPRFVQCVCQKQTTETFSPLADLLHERTAPELLYLETKWAALMSYGMTTELLTEVLPLGEEVSTTAVRQNVQRIAERGEQELGFHYHWNQNVR